jgi:Flp pilus assembly pilin Flp
MAMRLEPRRFPMLAPLVRTFAPLRFDEEGQTLVEYALILILVSVAAFTLLVAIGQVPSSIFSSVNADF